MKCSHHYRKEKKKKARGHKKLFEGDRGDKYTYYLDFGDGKDVYMSKLLKMYTLNVCF